MPAPRPEQDSGSNTDNIYLLSGFELISRPNSTKATSMGMPTKTGMNEKPLGKKQKVIRTAPYPKKSPAIARRHQTGGTSDMRKW